MVLSSWIGQIVSGRPDSGRMRKLGWVVPKVHAGVRLKRCCETLLLNWEGDGWVASSALLCYQKTRPPRSLGSLFNVIGMVWFEMAVDQVRSIYESEWRLMMMMRWDGWWWMMMMMSGGECWRWVLSDEEWWVMRSDEWWDVFRVGIEQRLVMIKRGYEWWVM